MSVELIILTELSFARPDLLRGQCNFFNRPALPHQPEKRFWASAQCGDEQVHKVKGFATTPAGAHQLTR